MGDLAEDQPGTLQAPLGHYPSELRKMDCLEHSPLELRTLGLLPLHLTDIILT